MILEIQETRPKDWGTNCVDCSRYKTLGEVCVIEHGKKFLWEFCRDFQPEVKLPEYDELMRTVKKEMAVEREKSRQKKKRERTLRRKELEEKRKAKKKAKRAAQREKRATQAKLLDRIQPAATLLKDKAKATSKSGQQISGTPTSGSNRRSASKFPVSKPHKSEEVRKMSNKSTSSARADLPPKTLGDSESTPEVS